MDRRQLQETVAFSLIAIVRTALVVGWLFLSLVQAQIGESQTPATDTSSHEVSGTVVNSVTGAPIARALVELDAPPSRYTLTDANGMFRFEGVAEGLVKLEAERPGFFKPSELRSEKALASSFQISGDMSGIVLKLVPQAEIDGRIRSIQGMPIQDFPIRLYEQRIREGGVQWEKVASLVCDREGYFLIFGLAEGSFVISAGPEQWRPRPPGAKHIGYPLVFYPNAHEFSGAGLISVSPGQHVEADFSLSEERLFEISGVVVGVPGAIDTKVELSSSAGDPLPLVQPHPERHEFFAYVTAGRYTLRTSAEVNGQLWHATLPLNITSNTSGIQVVMVPQLSIPVNLRTESVGGNPDRNASTLSAYVTLTSSTISLNPVQITAKQVLNRDQTVMEIAGAEPGTYSVEISPYNAYVKAATSGSTDLLQNDLLVPEDGRVAPIEISLSNDGGAVTGNVAFSDRDGGATVLLVPERGTSRNIKTATAKATGDFLFEQVRPGDYLLLAFDRVNDLEYRNPDVLGNYLSSATHISVPLRQQVKTTLDLIRLWK
jgi:carboxypeptidase family protein